MTALLPAVETGGEMVATALTTPGHRRAAIIGPAGAGKAAALRHTSNLIADDTPCVYLEASNDDLAPINLLTGLASNLDAVGPGVPATDDADRPPWDDLLHRCAASLDQASDELVVLMSGADHLQRLAQGGGTPGRHAAEVIDLLADRAPRLGTTTTVGAGNAEVIRVDSQDLSDWLDNAEVWGTLAPAAVAVSARGPSWWRLPALSVRLAVGLAALDALPDSPPSTPVLAARLLADALASSRTRRSVWAAWQLTAWPRGPLTDASLDILLEDLPVEVGDDPILRSCLLFRHEGWHVHAIVRSVAKSPVGVAAERLLPDDLVRSAGRRMVEHHRGEAARLEAEGDGAESAKNWAAALDACAMAQDDQLAAELTDDVPDPYDHVGRGSAHDLLRSHSAFDRARRIDQNDATALRGLADSEDRQAVDPAHVEELFRRVVELEPQDAPSHRRLVGVLLAAGRPQAAVDAFEQAAGALVGVLDENHFADDLLLPVARLAVAAGNLPLAARAATVACRTIELPEVREVDRLVAALIEAIEYGEFVAPQRLGTCWWKEPQLLGDFDFDHRPLTRWLAARVDGIDGDDASIHYADVSVSAQQRPERYWTSIAIDGLRVLSLDALPDPLPGAILEVGIYGDQVGPESTVVRVAETEEIVLPEPALSLDRYARN